MPFTQAGRHGVLPLLVKVLFLGTRRHGDRPDPGAVGDDRWLFLAAVWVIALILAATYATGRALPAKYLLPGVLFLTLFVVYPIILTSQLSTTNFGDGTARARRHGLPDHRVLGGATPDALAT